VTDQTKDAVIDWLKQQGVSTVLLFAILAFLGYAAIFLAPLHIDMIKQGYKDIADVNSQTIKNIVESHDRDRQMFVDLLNGRQLATKP
jgi:hypothetical protein